MNENNTVTIPLDEYFELRTRAEANAFLMRELGELSERLYQLNDRICTVERRLNER